MRLIVSTYTDPKLNLALEELIFKTWKDDVCLLYSNQSSVIIGKHQNAFAEVNLKYCSQNNIPVIRRISGGGTVYHDKGNVNISFITTNSTEHKVNYQPLLDLIIEYLEGFDLCVKQGERNDLYINGGKITGTACHIFKSRTLHHGTVLYDADMRALKLSTKVDLRISTKGVQSKRSSVINVRDNLSEKRDMSPTFFMAELDRFCGNKFNTEAEAPPSETSKEIIQIINERYATQAWNIDYSPRAKVEWWANRNYILEVEKGIIVNIENKTQSKEDMITTSTLPKIGNKLIDLIHA